MSEGDLDILREFQSESSQLVKEISEILEEIEGDYSLVHRLENFGQIVDRIMGGAQSMAMGLEDLKLQQQVKLIGDYASLCKAVSYKASQIKNNSSLYDICVALLMDAVETLEALIDNCSLKSQTTLKELVTNTFLDRLKWANSQFPSDTRASVAVDNKPKMAQSEIDDLLKKLGLS